MRSIESMIITSCFSKSKTALFSRSVDVVKRQYNNQFFTQLLLFSVHGCGTSDDTYMKALPAHVAVDHNHKHFDNKCSE